MVVYLAGLRAIPTNHFGAARVDGASAIRMYCRVIIPQLRTAFEGFGSGLVNSLILVIPATILSGLLGSMAAFGLTTIYVTHDQTEAMTMGDRIAILDDGVLQQVGTPLECYHTPNNEFVAGFICDPSMNFFEMEADRNLLIGDSFEYPLTAAQQESVGEARTVTFGIRPEDIAIEAEGRADSEHTFEVTVDVVEPRGDENTIHLTFDRNAADPETFTATVSGLRQLRAGDSVIATFPPEAIHLFDADSGQALHNRSLEVPEATEQIV